MIGSELAIQGYVSELTGGGASLVVHPPAISDEGAARLTVTARDGSSATLLVGPRDLPLAPEALRSALVDAAWLEASPEVVMPELLRALDPSGVVVVPLPARSRSRSSEGLEERLRRFFPYVFTLSLTPSWCWTVHQRGSPPLVEARLKGPSEAMSTVEAEPWGELMVASRRRRRMSSPLHLLAPLSSGLESGDEGRDDSEQATLPWIELWRGSALDDEVDRLRRETLASRKQLIAALRRGDDLLEEAALVRDELARARLEAEEAERDRDEARREIEVLRDRLFQADVRRLELEDLLHLSQETQRSLVRELASLRRAMTGRKPES